MINGKRIGVIGCKHTTLEFLRGLEREGVCVDGLITIDPEKGENQKVAGYHDLSKTKYAKEVDFVVVDKYNLNLDSSKKHILDLKLDILLVIGWQRLIPDWYLKELSIGAFGMHGSNKPLPHGRGRSPMNWSILQGKDIFFTHLFRYLPGVDNGPIVDFQKFQISKYDTCLTTHYKNTLSMIKLCSKNLASISSGKAQYRDQDETYVSHFPKRGAEDGIIFWQDSTADIYNLVRAVAKPFPGAFSFLENDEKRKLTIWRGIPFDQMLEWKTANFGEILEVFENGDFLIKTGDGSFLVQEYEGLNLLYQDVGKVFGPGNIARKSWDNLPV